jgi:hypothetical protein
MVPTLAPWLDAPRSLLSSRRGVRAGSSVRAIHITIFEGILEMRVNKLYIICIRMHDMHSIDKDDPSFEQPQFESEAKALALRSLIFEKADTVEIIQCAPFMYTKERGIDGRPLLIDRTMLSRGGGEADRPRIGVYIIAEGSTYGIGGLTPKELASLLKGYGIPAMDKLSLISCNIASDFPVAELPVSWKDDRLVEEGEPLDDGVFHNYVARACGILGVERMGNGDDGKLMVAGWTTYVTVAFPSRGAMALGKKDARKEKWDTLGWKEGVTTPDTWSPAEKLQKQQKELAAKWSGRKYALDSSRKKQPAKLLNPKPKVFYAWSGSGGLRVIQSAEWTDKT